MENNKPSTSTSPLDQGPDQSVLDAQHRVGGTQLSPLEEALFKGWGKANGIEDVESPESPMDFKGLYKHVNGQVFPPGVVQKMGDHMLLQMEQIKMGRHPAQDAPEQSDTEKDPIRAMIDMMGEVNKSKQIDSKAKESMVPKPADKINPTQAKIDVMKEKNKSKQLDVKEYELKHPKPKPKP